MINISTVRRFIRDTSVEPPGNPQTTIEFEKSIELIKDLPITHGRKILLLSYLNLGRVRRFGKKLGMEYGKFAKNPYDTRITNPVTSEMAHEIDGEVDIFMAPDDSDIFPGLQLATVLSVPFIRVRKNLNNNGSSIAAEIESYTRPGEWDTFSIEEGVMSPLLEDTKGRVGLGLDTVDVGEMTLLHAYLCELIREHEFPDTRLVLASSLFEKTYTVVKKRLEDFNIRLISGVQISDLGIKNEGELNSSSWIAIPQLPSYSLGFNKGKPIPTPSLLAALL